MDNRELRSERLKITFMLNECETKCNLWMGTDDKNSILKYCTQDCPYGHKIKQQAEKMTSIHRRMKVKADHYLTGTKEIDTDTVRIVARNLLYLRLKAKATLEELGTRIGIHFDTISKYEKGKRNPTRKQLIKYSEEFGFTIEELLEKDITEKAI